MTSHHIATAVAHLDAVQQTRDLLVELYKEQRAKGYDDKRGGRIAEAHQKIGHGLKAAGIHADIAQATALERIGDILAREDVR